MKPGDLEAIVGGYHGDPFAVLGLQSTAKGGWTPDTGIVHQVNLEYLAPVVFHRDGAAYPDTGVERIGTRR